MNLLIGILLLVFTVFFNFDESSASGREASPSGQESSPSEHEASPSEHEANPSGHEASPSGHGAAPLAPGLPEELRPYLTYTSDSPSAKNFDFKGQLVGVWYDEHQKVIGVGLESGNIIPSIRIPSHYKFRTYLAHEQDIYFLVYTLPNGYVVGIENVNWNSMKGGPSREASWSVIFEDRKIDIWTDRLGHVLNIRLTPTNIIPTGSEQIMYKIRREVINKFGFRFYAYRLRSGYITGVLVA